MGGADFVQWHGNYEILLKTIELEEKARELRERHGAKGKVENVDPVEAIPHANN